MKVIIVSDSHGNFGILKRIVEQEDPFDLMVHLGDGLDEVYRIQRLMEFRLDAVSGNNDPPGLAPEYLLLKFGKRRLLFTHGNSYQVNQSLNILYQTAKGLKANIVFYGHTHCYNDCQLRRIRFLNPGTVCSYLSKESSYIKMELLDNELKFNRVII